MYTDHFQHRNRLSHVAVTRSLQWVAEVRQPERVASESKKAGRPNTVSSAQMREAHPVSPSWPTI